MPWRAAARAGGSQAPCSSLVPRSAAVSPAACALPTGADAITPALIDAAKKEGKVIFYTAMDLPISREDRQGLRGEVPRHHGAGGAHRRRAGVPAHRPGICQQHPRRRRGQLLRRRRISSSGSATAGSRRSCRRTSRSTTRRSRTTRTACSPTSASWLSVDRLQHQSREGGGCAEELRRPARARNGPARWSRRIPAYSGTIMTATYRDVARSRLGLFREARQAAGDAGAVGHRSAQEARARRARGHGRRQRLQHVIQIKEAGGPVEIVYPAEGTPLIVGPNGVFKAAPNPNAARLFQMLLLHRRMPAADRRFRRDMRSFHPRGEGEAGPHAAPRHQGDEGGCRPAVEKQAERDQGALHQDLPGVSLDPRHSRTARRACRFASTCRGRS